MNKMTRDEILNMPAGFEMDALVAEKVMGWHIAKEWRDVWHDSDGRYQHPVSKDDIYTDDEDIHLIVWHPSESIMWAWDAVEKMREKGFDFYISNAKEKEVWFVSFDKDRKEWDGEDEFPPLAICRAALLAVLDE